MRITLSAKDLRHVYKFVSTDPTRPILASILIEPSGRLVATDGHTLAVVAPSSDERAEHPHREVCLVLPKRPPMWAEWFTVELGETEPNAAPDRKGWTRSNAVGEYWNTRKRESVALVEICGPFPAWRNVCPKQSDLSPETIPATVNPELLVRFAPEGTLVRAVKLISQSNRERAIVVQTAEPRHFGIIMPIRDVFTSYVVPSFAE